MNSLLQPWQLLLLILAGGINHREQGCTLHCDGEWSHYIYWRETKGSAGMSQVRHGVDGGAKVVGGVMCLLFSEIGQHLKRDSIFDRTVMVTQAPNGVGYIPTDAAYLLPAEKAVGNRIKPGCAEPAIINGFLEMMRDFLGTPKP